MFMGTSCMHVCMGTVLCSWVDSSIGMYVRTYVCIYVCMRTVSKPLLNLNAPGVESSLNFTELKVGSADATL